MQFDTTFAINIAGIAIMLYGLVAIVLMRTKVPGGVVGRNWKILTALVAMFTLAFLSTPFLGELPAESLRMIMSLVFLFGAIYVTLTVRLLYRIIEELS